jgi:hypothetical protein
MSRRAVTDYSTFAGDQFGRMIPADAPKADPPPPETDRRACARCLSCQRANAELLAGVLRTQDGSR